jgi:hypothetical protein
MDDSKAHYHWQHELGSLVEILANNIDDSAKPKAAAAAE